MCVWAWKAKQIYAEVSRAGFNLCRHMSPPTLFPDPPVIQLKSPILRNAMNKTNSSRHLWDETLETTLGIRCIGHSVTSFAGKKNVGS